MFGWSSWSTESLKFEQNGSDFRHCLKFKLFGNGTTLVNAEIRTFGLQTLTVFSKTLELSLLLLCRPLDVAEILNQLLESWTKWERTNTWWAFCKLSSNKLIRYFKQFFLHSGSLKLRLVWTKNDPNLSKWSTKNLNLVQLAASKKI